jgi:hypothetical protein
MKKVFLIFLTIPIISINCFSQSAEKTDYLKKSKNKKAVAWAFLGGGVAVSAIGLTQVIIVGSNSERVDNGTGTVLLAAGLATSLTSIPFFIASKKNKKRALTAGVNMQQIKQLRNSVVYTAIHPAFTVNIGI